MAASLHTDRYKEYGTMSKKQIRHLCKLEMNQFRALVTGTLNLVARIEANTSLETYFYDFDGGASLSGHMDGILGNDRVWEYTRVHYHTVCTQILEMMKSIHEILDDTGSAHDVTEKVKTEVNGLESELTLFIDKLDTSLNNNDSEFVGLIYHDIVQELDACEFCGWTLI
jgi:hypothetical protein